MQANFTHLAVAGAAVLGVLILIAIYNGLINKKNRVGSAFSTIDVLLKKRFDLIPNLVSAVKFYMKHEQSVLTQITELRAKAMSGKLSEAETAAVDAQMTRALRGLMVAVENYPELKANENVLQLQRSLNEVEEQISAARRAFNAAVLDYNNGVEMFPSNVVAVILRYRQKPFFEIVEAERQNVSVGALFT